MRVAGGAEGLRELRSAFHRLPSKDDSYRNPAWEPCLPVDLPPFLARLLARQVQGQPRNPCACVTQHGGTGRYVFLGPDGGHYRRSNYARRVFRTACDGRFASNTTNHKTPHPGPGRQGEDDLPNSSQPTRKPRPKITGEATRKSI